MARRIVKIGVKGETEQAPLIVTRRERHEPRGEVEEGHGIERSILQNANLAGLFDDEETAVAGRNEIIGRVQAAGHLLKFNLDRTAVDVRQERSG